jgi:cytochrome c biogenesis protein CcmG, thiol:disulfide interchange protein DsbE
MNRAGVAGLALLGLIASSAIHDAILGAVRFHEMGPLAPGREVPEFRVALVDGGVFANADLVGRVHVVTFWATWCPYCRDELDELEVMVHAYAQDDVRVVAVNREGGGLTAKEATAMSRRYRDAKSLSFPIAVDDGRMARAFGVGPIPHTAIFDRQGKLRRVHQGRVSGETIAREVDELVAQDGAQE